MIYAAVASSSCKNKRPCNTCAEFVYLCLTK